MDNRTNKMLIDATHPEETRVVVLRNGRVEEFDYESAARKLLRGNIYLAKVTRVEPSLQAAFVEYGGNRHGFLAFNEIHPDYYQIPMSDRQALIDEEAAAEAEAEAEADARAERRAQGARRRDGRRGPGQGRDGGQSEFDAGTVQPGDEQPYIDAPMVEGGAMPEAIGHHQPHVSEPYAPHDQHLPYDGAEQADAPLKNDHDGHGHDHARDHTHGANHDGGHAHAAHEHASAPHDPQAASHFEPSAPADGDAGQQADHIEQVADVGEAPETLGAEGDVEDSPHADDGADVRDRPRRQRRRHYKIQEVIKRRQVILVQVVKEERGNKGAALTTYLSLAGRYTVLMPNTGRGGGISRKIVNPGDRKRLKAIAQELDVQDGMGLIIRTAGAARTSQEIKRDYEYLLRLWESVRELTLQSTAPSLVYEEGNLIKRSIRDLYTKEIEEIVVSGDHAFDEAHAFMRMLMPSHTKNVTRYAQAEPIFARYPIERQLAAMFSPYVNLKSGGYLVINQTEALVSIDINSGKSTREYSIEETALQTNLEASDEIARQLKLRDLAGLIVIDFIDMEEKRNNRAVERRLTDALRHDRARIQVGRISHFGLLEMSRQRMRTGMLEGSTSQCSHCQGSGVIRSTESVALAVLRGLDDHLVKDPRSSVNVLTTATVALYILNNKRSFIADVERRYGIQVFVQASDRMQGSNFAIERSTAPVLAHRAPDRAAVSMDWGLEGDEPVEHDAASPGTGEVEVVESGDDADDQGGLNEGNQREGGRGRRRRRRGRDRNRGDRNGHAQHGNGNGEANGHAFADAGADHGEHHATDVQGTLSDDAAHGDDMGQPASEPRGEGDEADRQGRRGRRRGRRGGRRGREHRGPDGQLQDAHGVEAAQDAEPTDGVDRPHDAAQEVSSHEAPNGHTPAVDHHEAAPADTVISEPIAIPREPVPRPAEVVPPQPAPVVAAMPVEAAAEVAKASPIPVTQLPEAPVDPARPARSGWWKRR